MKTHVGGRRRFGSRAALPAVGTAALVALATAAGCDWFNRRSEPPTAPPPVSRIPDVPVPVGFKFDAGQSNDRIGGDVRVVVHTYKGGLGSMNVAETCEWYRQSMPGNGWQKMEESFSDKCHRFLFVKGNENCWISIWDDWGTKILIQIFPKGAKPPEPSLEPGS
jgi:hypothetical protein